MYLLDTMVLSEFQKRQPDSNVSAWINSHPIASCYLSVITIGEIYRGICKEEKRNPPFALRLLRWVEELKADFGPRLLAIDNEVAAMWGVLSWHTGNSGADNLIAATAKVHNLVVVTRNIKHFQQTGIACVNPWDGR